MSSKRTSFVKSEQEVFVEKMLKAREESKSGSQKEQLKRDTTPMQSYYRNWNGIDVEAELKRIDNDETIGFDKTVTDKGQEIT